MRSISIVLISTILGVLADWRIPAIDHFLWDWLRSMRGTTPAPEEIAIVAIDEPSLVRLGPFPWPRTIAARALDAIAAAHPKAIALDVLYADPTTVAEDSQLARSIANAGNVVVAAQLVDQQASRAWLLPLPEIARSAAALGHVNISTGTNGVAQVLPIRAADDSGRTIRAMAVETVRVGDGAPEKAVTETQHTILLGSRVIPVNRSDGARMAIEYIGPAGSFSPRTYSFVDVIEGRARSDGFRGKYVLIGATAASLGGRIGSMPGVEVLANEVNTIVRSRFYSQTSDVNEILFAAMAAALTLGVLSLAKGRHKLLRQTGALAAIAAGIVIIGYITYTRFLIYPALTAELISFASAALLALGCRACVPNGNTGRQDRM